MSQDKPETPTEPSSQPPQDAKDRYRLAAPAVRTRWLPVAAAAVTGLALGVVAGFALDRPPGDDRPRVVTRRVEVTPQSCADALASASAIVEEAGRVPAMVRDAQAALESLDFGRLEELGQQALALADRIQNEAARAGVAVLDCRSKVPSG